MTKTHKTVKDYLNELIHKKVTNLSIYNENKIFLSIEENTLGEQILEKGGYTT